jgi:Putative auto-transporter adhesin, head GIN domain
MKRNLPLLFALLALALAPGRAGADPRLAREPRTVTTFHAIDLAGTLGVEVTLGKAASVEVVGDPGMLDQVLTTVKDGVLVLDTKPRLAGHHHLRAIVTAPDLASLSLSGTGGLKLTGLANERFAIQLSGTGAIAAAGTTGSLRVTVDGTGQLAAEDLSAKAVAVDVSGTGQASVRATQSLEARVTGTGSIDVYGKPASVKKSVTGVGSIHIE